VVRAGWPVTVLNPVAVPAPVASKAAAGTLVTCRWTWAVVPWPAAAAVTGAAGDCPSLTAISVPTRASTTATLPPTSQIRLRTWALRWAARLEASFSRAVCVFGRSAPQGLAGTRQGRQGLPVHRDRQP
jgi:hypothetical protein